jgi:uncharacterized CHY-type Zn-finger protein
MIVEETLETRWTSSNKNHYLNLGYMYTGHHTTLLVSSLHIPPNSRLEIKAICGECKTIRSMLKSNYSATCKKCHLKRITPLAHKASLTPELKKVRAEFLREQNKKFWSEPEFEDFRKSQIAKSSARRGILHPNWNPGLSQEGRDHQRLNDPAYKAWRTSVFRRDLFKCSICGLSKNLIAHHLDSYSRHKDLRTEITNGITLCENCHNEFHKRFTRKNNTLKQFHKFASCKLIQQIKDTRK